MQYHAKSLSDIAEHFDAMGKEAKKRLEKLRTVQKRPGKEQAALVSEMHTWFTARDILNSTKIATSEAKP